jgi:uncharacterized protein
MSGTLAGIAIALFLVGLVVGHAAVSLAVLGRTHALAPRAHWMQHLPAAPLLPMALAAIALGFLILTRPIVDWPPVALAYAGFCNVVAWIIVPASTAARQLRKTPAGVTYRDEPLPLAKPPGGMLDWVGPGKHAGWLRQSWNESLTLRATTGDVALSGLPRSFGALRVLHVSDLHFVPAYGRGYFEAVADAAAEWETDLVLFTGDLLDDEATLDWTTPVLGRLRGRLGQFAVLGNHDVIHRPARIRRALRAAGFTMLDGRWMLVDDGPRRIAIGGTSAPWGPSLTPDGRPEADATIVLSHSPDEFPSLASWGTVDLVVAGHNHGGQIRLPGIGPLVLPSRYGLRYDRGFFRRGRTVMEVTRGVGGKHPIRFRCPPEVVRLTLRPAQIGASPFASRVRRISDSTSRT